MCVVVVAPRGILNDLARHLRVCWFLRVVPVPYVAAIRTVRNMWGFRVCACVCHGGLGPPCLVVGGLCRPVACVVGCGQEGKNRSQWLQWLNSRLGVEVADLETRVEVSFHRHVPSGDRVIIRAGSWPYHYCRNPATTQATTDQITSKPNRGLNR